MTRPGAPAAGARRLRLPGDPLLAPLCLVVGLDSFGYTMILPLLPVLAERIGAPTLLIGVAFGLYAACQLVAAPLLGLWGDRRGVKPALIASQLGTALGFALLFRLRSPAVLLLSRAVDGATAGNVSLVYGVVLKALPADRHRAAYAALATATSAGILAGLVGAAALVRFGFDTLVVAVTLSSLVLAGLTALALPPIPRGDVSTSTALSAAALPGLLADRRVRVALTGVVVSTALQAAFLTTLPLLAERLLGFREAEITLALVALFAVAAVFQAGVLRWLNGRLDSRGCAAAAFGAAVAGGGVYGLDDRAAVVAGAAVVMGGCAMLGPSLTSLLGEQATALHEGALMGLNQSAVSLGQLLGPLAGYGLLAAGSDTAARLLLPALGVAGVALLADRGFTAGKREARRAPGV